MLYRNEKDTSQKVVCIRTVAVRVKGNLPKNSSEINCVQRTRDGATDKNTEGGAPGGRFKDGKVLMGATKN